MGQKKAEGRRAAGTSRRVRGWRRRLIAGGAFAAVLAGLAASLALNYGWSDAAREGDTAPAFALDDHGGRRVSLADYLGKKPVVLVFYMTYG
jgi:hypothetical protein